MARTRTLQNIYGAWLMPFWLLSVVVLLSSFHDFGSVPCVVGFAPPATGRRPSFENFSHSIVRASAKITRRTSPDHRNNSAPSIVVLHADPTRKHDANGGAHHDEPTTSSSSLAPSAATSLDPASDQAAALLCDHLGLSDEQFDLVLDLTASVCEWNDKINLVSRRDCRPATVLARHVLPSLACGSSTFLAALFQQKQQSPSGATTRVMDVGTGGGFPGLPLSIQYADTASFVLADSVGKKVMAVREMAQQLQLSSHVQTYHGRVEDYFLGETMSGTERFDVVTGRSVTALPQFCAWVQHLLKPKTGHLVYWTGGEIDAHLLEQTVHNVALQELMPGDWLDDHDKRILVFTAAAVRNIAKESGILVNTSVAKLRPTPSGNQRQQKRVKGSWKKKSLDESRQRGYENFQRFSSFSSSSPSSPPSTSE